MKKVFAVMMAAMLLFGMTGCGSSEPAADDSAMLTEDGAAEEIESDDFIIFEEDVPLEGEPGSEDIHEYVFAVVDLVNEVEGKLPTCGELLDYGDHHNLLEMRGSGYEHIVPSPNGERVVIYRYLAELLAEFGHEEESRQYRERAEAVKADLSRRPLCTAD